ncbi:nucleotidyltransferase substrate binding protein [Azohydromonas aeria]|uniref:nucleotidyltransferase substrate binding protein n=1 Tax=Azohydromonas aeria TaxID=2590212 RepID=UPI0012F70A51|nr:nucleotidyltransferase substrate binding protein [Azohydromonas aeria]
MELYIAPLARAVERLDEALRRCQLDPGDLLIQDGLVQRFEFGFDLGCKALRRCLGLASGDARAAQAMDMETLIGLAHAQGLLPGDWSAWRLWSDLRAHTGHDGEEPMGPEVVAAVPRFVDELRYLQRRLAGRVV